MIFDPGTAPHGERADWYATIAKENLSERAYLALREALMRGRLLPGERLILRPTSERFGISATPLREAFMKLITTDALGLDSRGTVFVPILSHDELIEVRNIRIDLEGRAAAAAAQIASQRDISALEEIQNQIAACHKSKSFAEAVDLNTQFHLALCRMAQLPILQGIVENLWVRCGPILSHLYDGGVPDWDPHPHVLVLQALRARDSEGCREAIQYDITNGGKGLLEHVSNVAQATDNGLT